jgi:peroxiredoxin
MSISGRQAAVASAKLTSKGKVPVFYLPSTAGGQSGPAATRSKYNLVLAFVDAGPEGEGYLGDLAAIYDEVLEQAGRAMVVMPVSLDEAKALVERMQLPFPVLADEGGAATARLLGGDMRAALCVADRYGVVYLLEKVEGVGALPPARSALEWLEFVEIQCPE